MHDNPYIKHNYSTPKDIISNYYIEKKIQSSVRNANKSMPFLKIPRGNAKRYTSSIVIKNFFLNLYYDNIRKNYP